MKVSEAIEKLTVKRDDALHFQKLYRAGDVGWSANESKAIAFNIAINTLQQIDEPQAEKVEVPDFVAEWYESNKYKLERAIIDVACSMEKGEFPYNLPFEDWFIAPENHPIETLISMMKDGYTVKPKRWVVNEGDLVIRKGKNEAKVYFVEAIHEDGILLVNGIKDHFFTDMPERAVDDESVNYFYKNFRLLAKKENLEAEAVATLVEGSVEGI